MGIIHSHSGIHPRFPATIPVLSASRLVQRIQNLRLGYLAIFLVMPVMPTIAIASPNVVLRPYQQLGIHDALYLGVSRIGVSASTDPQEPSI